MNEYMNTAIDLSNKNLKKKYGGPFGACIVKNGKIVGKGLNRVIKDNDPTAHAEIQAIRNACKKLKTHDLSDCEIYTSCYPCPMCLSAIIWSNIKKVYYCNTKEDAEKIGFRDNIIYDYLEKNNKELLELESMDRKEALEIFKKYQEDKNKIKY